MKKRFTLIITLLALVSLSLAACQASRVEIGMVETTLPGEWHADYTTFTGRKSTSLSMESGEVLDLAYDVYVEKGSLTLQLESPDERIIWDRTFERGAADQITLSPDQAGRYTLALIAEDAGGGWDLNWDTR